MISVLSEKRVLPAVTFSSLHYVLPVAEAFLRGGMNIMEVALRTDTAIQAIGIIKANFPEMTIGAGTILNISQLQEAVEAGAEFGLSPSLNLNVVNEAMKLQFPFIPGVMTPSEIETAYNHGCTILKLFPVSSIGGISFLKAIQSPYAHLPFQFIPMGGINLENMNEYLSLKNVIAVGGSWLATESLMKAHDYQAIEKNSREALQVTGKQPFRGQLL